MSPILTVVLVLVAAAVAGALGFYLGGENRKRTAEAKIGSAEEEAKRIVNECHQGCRAEAQGNHHRSEGRSLQAQERRGQGNQGPPRRDHPPRSAAIDQKEEALDKRTAQMERKEEDLKRRSETVEARLDELGAAQAAPDRKTGNHRRHVQGGRPRRAAQAGR